MNGTHKALDFLESSAESIPATVAIFGDEGFLKRLVRRKLCEAVVGQDPTTPYAKFDGTSAQWRDVADELATRSLFGNHSQRLVVVEDGDDLVTKFREQIEDYVARPRRTGILVLEVGAWASNTRLYKKIHEVGLQIECRLPQRVVGRRSEVDESRLLPWLANWSQQEHGVELDAAAAKLLWELAGPELGLVDQDLAKLALFAGPKGKITTKLVQDVVGGWRAKTVWETIDAAAAGDAAEALRQLDRALQSGEHPQALFGQVSWSLRRFTAATRAFQQAERRGERITLRAALLQAGFKDWPPNALVNSEKHLMQLGRDRAGQLLKWLLDADLAMKGTHSAPDRARFSLELLFLRLAKRSPAAASPRPRERGA